MKKFLRQYIKLPIIAVVASIFLGIIFFIYYDTNDLFRFPFNSNVWGTASDWIMIFVTVITAILLVRTFEEQKRANNIAYSQHRKTILPKFRLEGLHFEDIRDNGFLRVYVHDNELYDLDVSFISNTFIDESHYFPQVMTPNTNLVLHIRDLNENHTGTRQCCSFTYTDNEGNKYEQRLELQIPGSFRITPPRLIE